jgi:hypothetical protein
MLTSAPLPALAKAFIAFALTLSLSLGMAMAMRRRPWLAVLIGEDFHRMAAKTPQPITGLVREP